MNFISIVNFLLIAGVIQGFVFILVTLCSKKKIQKAIIYLNLIVLFISLNNLQAWLIDNGYSSSIFLIQQLQLPWYILIFPAFYAFTTHFIKIENKVNDFVKLTLVIFISEIVIRLCLISYVYYNVPDQSDLLIKRYTAIEEICNLIYCMFIFINASLLIFRRHKLLEYILAYDDLKWLKWFIRLGSFLMMLWVTAVVISNVYDDKIAYYPLRLGDSILLYWIAYQGFYKYNVVRDRILLRSSIEDQAILISSTGNVDGKKRKDAFQNEKHQKEFNAIRDLIVSKRYYLDPLLSMETLTLEIGMSKSHFSKLINSYSNFNFSDFINSLRVEQAKIFLANDDFSAYTIVAIGLECGFNSKSTFYSAFKKFTSDTPSTYRDRF